MFFKLIFFFYLFKVVLYTGKVNLNYRSLQDTAYFSEHEYTRYTENITDNSNFKYYKINKDNVLYYLRINKNEIYIN